jgi:L-alanine-DL-glutamate epimerase-like enolase superfamily enzyme
VAVPICADEAVFDDKDAFRLLAAGAADYLGIKLGKAGGIGVATRVDIVAQSAGARCVLGCSAESRLGLSAAAHFAAAHANIAYLDLDSAYFLESDPAIGGIRFDPGVGGLIHLGDAPGHGACLATELQAHALCLATT